MPSPTEDPNDRPWQVLLVSDSPAVRERVRTVAEVASSRFEVYEAESVLAATEVLRTAEPSCVLAAARLPGGTGLELSRSWPDIPFVLLASEPTEHERQGLVAEGVDDVLAYSELDAGSLHRSVRYAVGRKLHARAMEALARSDRLSSLGRLSANVAHEINNPLAFMLANLDALSQQMSSIRQLLGVLREEPAASSALDRALTEHPLFLSHEETEQVIGDTIDGAQRIAAIVRQLGSFARGTADDEEPVSRTSLSDIAARACDLVRKRVEKQAALVVALEDDTPFAGRPGQLVQVVTNLVFNAAQAVPDGKPRENTVWVETSSDADSVQLVVEDTGPGFSWRVRRQAFDPFFTTKAPGEGSGLGLAIAHDIARAHGGTITLGNRPEGGARVVLTVPRETGLEARTRDRRSTPSPDRANEESLRILVVDDEASIRRAFGRLLRGHVVVSETATEALERIASRADRAFDLVLCDVSMPDMDGLVFFAWLEETAPELAARFAFLTGGALNDDVRDALDRSAVPILRKPASKKEIVALARVVRGQAESDGPQASA